MTEKPKEAPNPIEELVEETTETRAERPLGHNGLPVEPPVEPDLFEPMKDKKGNVIPAEQQYVPAHPKPVIMAEIISYADLRTKDIPPVKYLVEPIIPEAGLVSLFGPPGAFKTNLGLDMSMYGADGQNFLDFHVPRPFKTLWVDEENRLIGMKDKIDKLANGIKFNNPDCLCGNFVCDNLNLNLMSNEHMLYLRERIRERHPDMVVIDSVAKVFPLDERDEQDVKKIYTQLSPLIKEFGVTIVLIHHSRKMAQNQKSRGLEDLSGSREFSAMMDSILLLEQLKNQTYILKQVKNRYSQKCSAVNFQVISAKNFIEIKSLGLVSDIIRGDRQRKADTVIADLEKWHGETHASSFTTKEVLDDMEVLGHKRNSVFNALKELKETGRLKQPGAGSYEWQDEARV